MSFLLQNKIINSRLLYLLSLYLVFIVSYIFIFDSKLDLGGDNASYFILGKALAMGEGYVNLNIPGTPAANHYPPGYPLIVGLIQYFFINSFIAVKLANGFFLFLSGIATFFLFEKLTSDLNLAFTGSIFVLINPLLLRYSTIMMSEIPFLLFCLLTIYFFIKVDETNDPFKSRWFYLFVCSLVISFYIKTLAIGLFAGILFFLLLKKRWRIAGGTTVAYLLCVSPWMIRGQLLEGGSYLNSLIQINPYRPELGQLGVTDLFQRLLLNLQRYITIEIPSNVLPFISPTYTSVTTIVEWIIAIFVFGLISFGIYSFKKYRLLVLSYLFSTFGILLIWPEVWVGGRFLLGIMPVLIFSFFLGFYTLINLGINRLGYHLNHLSLYLAILGLLFIPELRNLHTFARSEYPTNWKAYFSIALWVNEHTPEETVISCRKPALFYLIADRFSVRYNDTPDDKALVEDLRINGVDYIVMDQLGYASTPRYLTPAVEQNRELFEAVLHDQTTNSYLLRLIPN